MNTELPYAGTSGWSGSETSRERAVSEDARGTTTMRQGVVLSLIRQSRNVGMTWREVSEVTGWHHGQASGVLSVLHKTGHLVRLTDRRDRCALYVMPEWVQGRDTSPHGGNKRKCCPHCGGVL